jgi:hypothetical protein
LSSLQGLLETANTDYDTAENALTDNTDDDLTVGLTEARDAAKKTRDDY